MRLSQYFLPVLKEAPKEAELISHRLMLRAGLIQQQSAGIYAWLPLGLRVLDKVTSIIRQEQNRAGAIELLMPMIQSADLWRESGRYEAYGKEMLRIKDRHERDMLYGPTNEEMITAIFRSFVRSYKELPLNLYQIQWKFRDEIRPRFGVMRSREFLMKDAYSFDLSAEDARVSYTKMFVAYLRTFARMGLTPIPMRAESGPIGGDMSHEFVVLASTGESEVFCDGALLNKPLPPETMDFSDPAILESYVQSWTSSYAATSEMHDPETFAAVPKDRQIVTRGIEVGHIFYFGEKYSHAMGATVTGPDGQPHSVHMGSYGIGPSRLVAALIEAYHDDKGIMWPESVAPFDVVLLNLAPEKEPVSCLADQIYATCNTQNISVLYDDRQERAGVKFSTADLIGIPWHILVGAKSLESGMVELKQRATGTSISLPATDVIAYLKTGKAQHCAVAC